MTESDGALPATEEWGLIDKGPMGKDGAPRRHELVLKCVMCKGEFTQGQLKQGDFLSCPRDYCRGMIFSCRIN